MTADALLTCAQCDVPLEYSSQHAEWFFACGCEPPRVKVAPPQEHDGQQSPAVSHNICTHRPGIVDLDRAAPLIALVQQWRDEAMHRKLHGNPLKWSEAHGIELCIDALAAVLVTLGISE